MLAFLAIGFFAVVGLAFPVVLAFFAVDVYFLVVGVATVDFDAVAFGLAVALDVVLAFKGFLVEVTFLTVAGLALVAAGFLIAGLVF